LRPAATAPRAAATGSRCGDVGGSAGVFVVVVVVAGLRSERISAAVSSRPAATFVASVAASTPASASVLPSRTGRSVRAGPGFGLGGADAGRGGGGTSGAEGAATGLRSSYTLGAPALGVAVGTICASGAWRSRLFCRLPSRLLLSAAVSLERARGSLRA
jgi:hypothetical protein